MKKKTIQDVAREAGVSITTVSRVINKNYPVKDSTRKRVEEVIDKLAFKPNLLAKGLIESSTKTIGILTPSIENLFFSEVIRGIDSIMKPLGFTSFLCHTEGCDKSELEMINTLVNRQVDGIIMIDPRRENIESGFLEDLSCRLPLVLINGYSKDVKCNYILNDVRRGTLDALDYLMESGCKKIAFLRGGHSFSYDIKESIYSDFVESRGLKKLILSIPDGNDLNTLNMAQDEVSKAISSSNPPDGILCCNDWMAVGALNATKSLKLESLARVKIIGFDNTVISQITDPKLTTVDQQMSRLGTEAAKRLKTMIKEDDSDNQKIYLETKLIIRES